jgi:23S rRNA pseudouridine1911/1915/1917 synthase
MAKGRQGKAGEEEAQASIPRRWEGRVGPAQAAQASAATAGAEGRTGRIDRYIAEVLGILTRSQIKARKAVVRVNGRPAKLSSSLKEGDSLVIEWLEEPSLDLVAENLPLRILYEDDRVVVVDKAQGMVTHPGHGNHRGTLANALLGLAAAGPSVGPARAPGFARSTSVARAGIVHRLDKETSGVIIAAKDAEAQAFLAAQFKDRTTRKEYLAITRGVPRPPEGRIENRLGRDPRDRKRFAAVAQAPAAIEAGGPGKLAVTDYRVLRAWGGYALVSLRPKTGRTHQLRVHLAGLGCPILGDPIYGKADPGFPGASLMLHAFRLRIRLPGAAEASLFKAPLPARFRRLMAHLEARWGHGEA